MLCNSSAILLLQDCEVHHDGRRRCGALLQPRSATQLQDRTAAWVTPALLSLTLDSVLGLLALSFRLSLHLNVLVYSLPLSGCRLIRHLKGRANEIGLM